jgi:hypothetical protein
MLNLYCGLYLRAQRVDNRIRLISHIRDKPFNVNQLAKEMNLDYKAIQEHHHHVGSLKRIIS